MNIIEKDIADLKEYENNPRENDVAAEAVAESIKEFGFKVPIIIDCNNVIIAGHTRLKAARLLGLVSVPCIVADDLSPEQIKAFRLADNKTGELAEWDYEALKKEIEELTALDVDMTAFGFDESIFADIELTEDDGFDIETVAEEIVSDIKRGDVWQLGEHRLICGDSTDVEEIERLMDGHKADLLLTDPPYNVAVENSAGMTIENDDMSDTAFYELLTGAFSSADRVMRDGAGFYIWHGESEGYNFRRACESVGWDIKQCLIWVKSSPTIGRQDYQWKHEPCLYGWKDGASHYFVKNRKQKTVIDDDLDIEFLSADELREYIRELTEPSTIIREGKPQKNGEHPTMKPIPLIEKQIKNSSKKGDIVLDLFGGSGTTLIACEELGRVCYMSELDPKYCDVIIKRWEHYTGGKAVLLQNETHCYQN